MVSTHLFMSTLHLHLIFFLSLLATASYLQLIKPVSCTKSPVFRCSEVEREALLSFKDSLTDPSGRLSSSWVGEDCCNWKGVGCDNSTGNVVKLDLKNSFPLSEFDFIFEIWTSDTEYEYHRDEVRKAYKKSCLGGKISPSLLNLKHLSYLDLSLNNFNGTNVPRFLGSLESLRYLNLSFSTFAGVIPPHLGNLSRLQYLDLNSFSFSFDYYHDSFPSLEVESIKWLVGFPSLRYLNLGYVNLTKVPDWLDAINMLPSLVELHLQGCGLVNLPHSVSSINFTLLSFLDLSHNSFDSIIPHWLSNVSDLSIINLSSNQFTGDIPVGIGNLTNLRSLDLRGNNLIGKIPNSFANLCNLQTLDLYNNNISGEITEFVDGLSSNSSLEYLDLSFNRLLGGNLPYSLGGLKKLKNIHLSGTSVGGSIPDSIGNLSSLQALDLSDTSVGGSIPDSIGNLSSLQALDLSGTSVGGSIPDSIGNLSSLQALRLSRTSVRGSIPDSIGNLSSLQALYLSGTSVGGSIPDSIGNLSSLQELYLSGTSVGGSIPDSIGNLSSLQALDLSFIGGSIPDSIGNLLLLQTLDLSYNQMNGTIPESIGKLSMLVSLSLDGNSSKGILTEAHFQYLTRLKSLSLSTKFSTKGALDLDVKHDWVPPFKLRTIRLANMRIGPNFPAWLKTQNELEDLNLNNVGISGTIPHGLWKSYPNVTYWSLFGNNLSGQVPYFRFHPFANTFDLSSNNLEGPLPLFRSNLSNIILSNNMFSGPIPKNIGELLPNLFLLALSSNSITGKIPHSIGMLKELNGLYLGNNSLFGKLPPHWKDLQQLYTLDLAENNISGNIPSSMRHLSSLKVLSLRQNHLEGELPSFFGNYRNLQSLDLGRNKFSGKLPAWIGESLPSLLRLNLRSNLFHGDIPQQLCLLSQLQILDLAHNDFSGAIPRCLGNFSHDENDGSHYYYDFQMLLVSKGREYLYDYSIIALVHSIDLSGNSLSGEIPDNITTIDSKLVFLNLSMNHLTGRIPEKIGNLHMLESLDLSMNELSGPIPESLSSLTFLSHLNLSFNNLSGRIPSGNQLQTLNDSSIYEGNFLLCGLHLSTKCSDDETKPRGTPNGGNRVANKNGMEIESYSFYISMAAGFIIGFWGVCGTLIIIRSWRQAFFRSFDHLKDKIVVFVRVEIVRFLRKVKYS